MLKKTSITILCFIALAFTSAFFLGCSNSKDAYVMPSHLVECEEKSSTRAISEKETIGLTTKGEPLITQLEEMERIIIDYERMPDFTGANEVVENTFNAAIQVLAKYVPITDSEFNKVHMIHDYLTSKIYYDSALYNEFLTGGKVSVDHESFLASGVLLKGSGVCDGIARAFNLLCGIEGIKSYRIVGAYSSSADSSLHAWNKVRIDGDWFNADATMDNITIKINSSEEINAYHHGYFLLSDKSISEPKLGKHIFGGAGVNPVDYPALKDYNILSVLTQPATEIANEKMEIKNQDELNALMEKINKANKKIKRVEVKLNFDKYAESEAISPAAYSKELFEAYKKINNSDFLFDLPNKSYPYIRYPNGVFVLLLYK